MQSEDPTENLKVSFFLTTLARGGAERQTVLLCRGLQRAGYTPEVVALHDGQFREDLERLGITVALTGGGLVGAARAIRRLRRTSPDCILSYHTQTNLLMPLMPRSTTALLGLRIVKPDGDMHSFRTRAIYAAEVRASRISEGAIANSAEAVAYAVERGFRRETTRMVPNAFDTDAFAPDPALRQVTRQSLGLSEHTTAILRVGNLRPPKDYPTFLAALAALPKTLDYRAFIAGGGDPKPLQDQAGSLGVNGRVTFLGQRTDINALLNAADVNVSSSSSESFPNVVAEGLAVGVATVATNVGDSAAIVRDHGSIAIPGNPVLLAEAIMREIDPATTASTPTRRRAHIVAEYSIDALASNTLDAIRALRSRHLRQ